MKFLATLLTTTLVATLASATPIPPNPVTPEVCGSQRISSRDISSALSAAWSHQDDPVGYLKKRYEPYPHQFNNREGFLTGRCATESKQGNTFEYPIIPGSVYQGGQPGKYRIIYYAGPSGPVYCDSVYHANGNTFKLCQ